MPPNIVHKELYAFCSDCGFVSTGLSAPSGASLTGLALAALRGAGFFRAGSVPMAASAAIKASAADIVVDPAFARAVFLGPFGVSAMTILRLLHCTI